MKTKFRKYWEEFSLLFTLASVMNLRFNIEGRKHIVTVISNKLTFESLITDDNFFLKYFRTHLENGLQGFSPLFLAL